MKVRTSGQNRISNKKFSESLNYFCSHGQDNFTLTINHDDKKLEIKLTNEEINFLYSCLAAQINARNKE